MKIAYDSTNYIIKYNDAIQSGKIVAGEKIKKVYKQLAKDCKRKKGFHFDIKQASRVIYFVETFCRQSKGDMGKPIKIVDVAKHMIELNNLQVGRDIEIVYTGIRPGEKLHEDLVFDPDKILPTENKLVGVFKDDLSYLSSCQESVSKLE